MTIRWPDFIKALEEQESGGGRNLVSVQGARGPRQMLPSTFKAYAQGGENIDNPRHNRAVSDRFLTDLWKQHGGDVRKISAAYFSGSPDYTSTKADANGRTVRDYVGMVLNRINPVSSAKAAEEWAPPSSDFSRKEDTEWQPPETDFAPATELDPSRGVPASIRAAVGTAPSADLRLKTLQKFYPDAQITPTDDDNFEINDPKEGRFMYNPSGLDLGDVASIGPELSEVVGGAIGGAVAAPTGPAGTLAGIGLGAAAGRQLYQQWSAGIGGAKVEQPIGAQLADIGQTTAYNAAGQATGALAGFTMRGFGKAIARGGEQGRQQLVRAVYDANRWNVPLSVGEAFDNGWRVFDTLAPASAQRLKKAAAERAGLAVRELATDLGVTSRTNASNVGYRIQQGVTNYAGQMRRTGHALDQEFFAHVPVDSPVKIDNFQEALGRMAPDMPSFENYATGKAREGFGARVARLTTDVQANGGVALLGDVRSLRRDIGEMIETGALVEGIPVRKLRDLYGALASDLQAAADAAGPAARAAFDQANTFWARELRAMEEITGPLIAKNTPEKIYKALTGSLKDGPTVAAEVMRTLSPRQRDIVRGSILRRMGNVSPSAQDAVGETWSFDKYLTDWNNMDKATRNVVFRDRTMVNDLEQLARTSERLHSRSGRAAVPTYAFAGAAGNLAMTAGATFPVAAGLAGAGMGAGWFALPVGFALTSMGAAGGQRLMRNRQFIHWLSETTRVSPQGISGQIGRLVGIGKNSDAQTREDISVFLDTISDTGQAPPPQ